MFVFIFILFVLICVLSVFTVYKILEIEKDINTLYDNYSKELENINKLALNRGSRIC